MARLIPLLLLITTACPLTTSAQDGVIDLTTILNYANQTKPNYITRDNTPADNTNLDPRLRRPGGVQNLNLSQQQRNDLAAFLRTLTGSSIYTDEKWSNPFDGSDRLSLIILPASASTLTDNRNGTATLRARAAPGLGYRLEWSDDLSLWHDGGTFAANNNGEITTVVTPGTRTFYRFVFETPDTP